MLVENKRNTLEMIMSEAVAQMNSKDRKVRLKGRINYGVAKMVELSTCNKYHISDNSKSGINKGYIVEDIVLDWKGLETETKYCEVKYFGNETPNPLVNENVRLVYIVVNKATCKGAYIIRDMKAIRNKRLTLDYLIENNLLNHKCEELSEYLGLNA